MPGLLKGLFAGGAEKLVATVGTVIDNLSTSKEEKEAAKLAALQEVNRHMEALQEDTTKQLELILADKQSAREMFKANSTLQKIYAIVFLTAYVILSLLMIFGIYEIAVEKIEISDWGIGFVSSIFGAMSIKVGTVTDFLFGSSMPGDKK